MYEAEKYGNHEWAFLVLFMLKKVLTKFHTNTMRAIKGRELIDV